MTALEMSSSTPALPTIHESSSSAKGGTTVQKKKEAQRMRMMQRRPKEAPRRQAFVEGLLNEDLQKLTQWHGWRPHHEQRRFLRSVDTMYKAFCAQDNPPPPNKAKIEAETAARAKAMEAAQQAQAAAAWRAAEEDPLNGPPRSPGRAPPGALGASASAPDLPTAPIEVFEQRKRAGMAGKSVEDMNSLERWLEAGSVTTATTGTTATSRYTSLTQKTKTTSQGSICSEPGTWMQADYRIHKRAFALNNATNPVPNQHLSGALKDGVPNIGLSDSERLNTTFRETYGAKPPGGDLLAPQMYQSVFKNDSHPFVHTFLQNAKPAEKEQFAGLVRSLEYLRNAEDRRNKSTLGNDYNLEENRRLWKPPRQRPWFEAKDSNLSQVPGLGTLNKPEPKAEVDQWATPPPGPPPGRAIPPSPSVSGLGSMPLSRLSTPVGSFGMTR